MNRSRTYGFLFWKCSTLVLVVAVLVGLAAGAAFAQLTAADIEKLKAQGKAEGWTFEVGENSATGYSIDQLCGFKMPDKLPEGIKPLELPATTEMTLPATFDWRVEKGLPPIRNQGGCGSCWAFATAGAMECAIKIKDNVVVDLSEQFLVSCNQEGWSCAGGWWAHGYYQNVKDPCGDSGAVMETAFPYRAANLSCACPYPHEYWLDSWGYIGQPYTVASVSQLKQAIMLYGPVAVAVSVNSAFQAYHGGVFTGCANGEINHAVVLVGWDDTQSGGVWFMRNSWGTGWGEAGYMRIPYGCSLIGYNSTYVNYKGTLWFTADSSLAKVPATVGFAGQSLANVSSWNWDFGDGGTANEQNPTHMYTQPGTYDVTLTAQSDQGQIVTKYRNCVSVYGDTLTVGQANCVAGQEVRLDISLRNYLPISKLEIPFEWSGPAGLMLESLSTAGLRTSFMANQGTLSLQDTRAAYQLACDPGQSDLPAGTGPVLRAYFWVPSSATGCTTPITITNYSSPFRSYTLSATTGAGAYAPDAASGAIRICLAGDVNSSGTGPDLSDLSLLIGYLFKVNPVLPNPPAANVDGKGLVDLSDLSMLISFLLTGGPKLSCSL